MTTWAYKNGEVAVDTCVSGANNILGRATKLDVTEGNWAGKTVLPTRRVVIVSAGSTGLVQWVHRAIKSFLREAPIQEMFQQPIRLPEGLTCTDDFSYQVAVFVEGAGHYWTTTESDHGFWCELDLDAAYPAGGMGCEYAVGAMVAGMSAPDAVRVAAMFDHGTNNELNIAKVDQ